MAAARVGGLAALVRSRGAGTKRRERGFGPSAGVDAIQFVIERFDELEPGTRVQPGPNPPQYLSWSSPRWGGDPLAGARWGGEDEIR